MTGAGQEAAQVGAAMALRKGTDYLAPYYRDLGMNLVFGMTAREAMLNLLAKRDDPHRHRPSSLHGRAGLRARPRRHRGRRPPPRSPRCATSTLP